MIDIATIVIIVVCCTLAIIAGIIIFLYLRRKARGGVGEGAQLEEGEAGEETPQRKSKVSKLDIMVFCINMLDLLFSSPHYINVFSFL